jgi:hypothetical protein
MQHQPLVGTRYHVVAGHPLAYTWGVACPMVQAGARAEVSEDRIHDCLVWPPSPPGDQVLGPDSLWLELSWLLASS